MSEYPDNFTDWFHSREWWKYPIEEMWEAYVMLGGPDNHDVVVKAIDIIISVVEEEFGQ